MKWRQVLGKSGLDPQTRDDQEGLAKAKVADYLMVEIQSSKDEVPDSVLPAGSPKIVPVSTVVKFRFGKTGQWYFITDADSGEQDGLATDIPESIKQLLLAFGLRERPKK